jgi:hypothetical protein
MGDGTERAYRLERYRRLAAEARKLGADAHPSIRDASLRMAECWMKLAAAEEQQPLLPGKRVNDREDGAATP